MKKILLILYLSTLLIAGEFEDYKNAQNAKLAKSKSEFGNYKDSFEKQFKEYKTIQQKALDDYKSEISKYYPTKEVSTKHKWVEYSPDYKEKKSIDYKNEIITLEVIASNNKEAQDKFLAMFNKLYDEDVAKASSNDILEKKIKKLLPKNNIYQTTSNNQDKNSKLLADMLDYKQKNKLIKSIKNKKPKLIKYNKRMIYKLSLKLPRESILNKAKKYKRYINAQARKTNINKELILAIIHSESSFNPMARSYVPAFGLMQIVPRTAGVDAYKFIYSKHKIPSAYYLYQPQENILLGSTYLHILYYNYLSSIKNPTSRLYCTIAAYNTGAGNVARAFTSSTNIKYAARKINQMSDEDVYRHLMNNLAHSETKKYLKVVLTRVKYYKKYPL